MHACKTYHFIGIGGIGMSAIAQMLHRRGCHVTGSDPVSSSITDYLKRIGIGIYSVHQAANIGSAECVVYSSSIREDNPEFVEAKRRGLRIMHRSEALAMLSHDRWTAAVSGTHGKTTTTAMLGRIFQRARRFPTIVVGARIPQLRGNVLMGPGEDMILEADESDASFLAYHPDAIIVTNIDSDHLDHFGHLENVYLNFKKFIQSLKPGGYWVGCGECPLVKRLFAETTEKHVSYGLNSSFDYSALAVLTRIGYPASFDFAKNGERLGRITLKVVGKHNVLNALAAAALAMEHGISFDAIRSALESYEGASRRFDIKHSDELMMVVDDYAHHPTEIQSTIRAAQQFSDLKIRVVFQPHRYSRTHLLKEEFGPAFSEADELILTDIYAASEQPIPGISSETLIPFIEENSRIPVSYIARDKLFAELSRMDNSGYMILCMGAGDIGQFAEELRTVYARNFSPSAAKLL